MLCLGALSLAACGDDAERAPVAPATTPAGIYTLTAAERGLEDGGLDLQRDGGTSTVAEGLDPDPRTSQVYTAQDNSQLDLLVFATPDDAEAALPKIAENGLVKDGGASSRAGNLVLVISSGPKVRDAYAAAFEVFRTLGERAQQAGS